MCGDVVLYAMGHVGLAEIWLCDIDEFGEQLGVVVVGRTDGVQAVTTLYSCMCGDGH